MIMLNIKAIMTPSPIRDKYLTMGFQMIEKMNRELSYNFVQDFFNSENARVVSLNGTPFVIQNTGHMSFSDMEGQRSGCSQLNASIVLRNDSIFSGDFLQ